MRRRFIIKTKRWCDAINRDDGWRVLVTRFRPRALLKKHETWNEWFNQLGPSAELHALRRGRHGRAPISWEVFRKRYLKEMENKESRNLIACLAKMVEEGLKITLLCSADCVNKQRCHRTLLEKLINKKISANQKRKQPSTPRGLTRCINPK